MPAQIRKIPGATDVFALRNAGLKYLTVKIDRSRPAGFGLNATDVQDALRVWVDGRQLGIVLEGAVRTPLFIRGEESCARSAATWRVCRSCGRTAARSSLRRSPTSAPKTGRCRSSAKAGNAFATVLANVRGRDLVGFVAEAQAAVADKCKSRRDYALDWGGQFENQQRAAARLAIVLPIALGLIFLLLYLTFGSLRQAMLVFCNVPFATIGGIIALWASGRVPVGAGVGRLHRADRHRGAQWRGADLLHQRESWRAATCLFREAVMEGARAAACAR